MSEGLSALALLLANACEKRASAFNPLSQSNGGGEAAMFDKLHGIARRVYAVAQELEALGE